MQNETLGLDFSEFHENGSTYVLAEFLRGRKEMNNNDIFSLKEVKKGSYAALSMADDKFEAESECQLQSQLEHHALGFIENGTLRLVKIPYYFQASKRIKTETSKVIRRGSLNYMEKKEVIVQEIGTDKSKKILKNYKTKEIDEDKLASIQQIKNIMNSMAENLKEQNQSKKILESNQKLKNLKELVPEFNPDAKKIDQIYPLESIITNEDLKLISEDFCESKIKGSRFSRSFNSIQEKIEINFEKMSGDVKRYWIYLDFMLVIFPMRKINKQIGELAKEKRIPQAILSKFIDLFYEKSTDIDGTVVYTKTQKLSIKFAAYITVLFLILNDFKFEISILFSVLTMPEREFFK